MKRVVLLVHGVGRHESGWSSSVEKAFGKLLAGLEADGDFDPDPLAEAFEDTYFIEVLYDDIYQQFIEVMLEREPDLIKGLRFSGLKKLADAFTEDSEEENFVRDNIMDVIVYRAMREHRFMTRKHVALQVMKAILEHGVDDVEYSIIAHSMGTAVIHDTLQEMASESGSPLRHGLRFTFKNLIMIANTSALLRNDYDPRGSLVRPFIGPADPGYVSYYWDIAHKFDPVAQIYGYARYMKGQSAKRYRYVTIDRFQSRQIHALTHYFNDPAVHMEAFSAIYGRKLVPDIYRDAVAASDLSKQLGVAARAALIARLEPDLEPGAGNPDDRSKGLIAIAKHLAEVA